jgi:hypothetical protein
MTDLAAEIAYRRAAIQSCDEALHTLAHPAHEGERLQVEIYRDRMQADLAALTMQADNIARDAQRQLEAVLAK